MEKTLKAAKDKALGEFVGKVREANRWADRPENRFLI
jgi:ABC-type nitrate/sulfonate/bicarbonate transport system substrate-binding protein